MLLEHLVTTIPWESDEQRKGFLALAHYLKASGSNTADLDWQLAHVAAFFIQKDHESHEWWASTVGDQVTRLQQDIKTLRAETDAQLAALRTNLTLEIVALQEELAKRLV